MSILLVGDITLTPPVIETMLEIMFIFLVNLQHCHQLTRFSRNISESFFLEGLTPTVLGTGWKEGLRGGEGLWRRNLQFSGRIGEEQSFGCMELGV